MLSLDLTNIFAVGAQGLQKKIFTATKKYLPSYLENIKNQNQKFFDIIDDENNLKIIKQFVRSQKLNFDDIVILGIGGSALGAKCITQGHASARRLHVIDNVDPTLISEIEEKLDLSRTLFLVISKSGSTTEPIALYLYFSARAKRKGFSLKKHFVFITDRLKNPLTQIAEKEGIRVFDYPPVGGRFSALGVVGLLPALFAEKNVDALLHGARDMRERFFSLSFEKNLPFQIAAAQFLLFKQQKTITVLMPYAQNLGAFVEWYRQLLAESIGKKENRRGQSIHTGITPVAARGTSDQHSQAQLYNEGPFDKMIIVIAVNTLHKSLSIPAPYKDVAEIAYLRGVTFNKLIAAERKATIDAFTAYKRPNMTITISALDEYHRGQLMMLFEGAVAFLGEFFNINAFDQPGVELAKKRIRGYLAKK